MNKIVKKIAELINESEGSLLKTQQRNFRVYLSMLDEYVQLSKTEKRDACEGAAKGIELSYETVQNNFGRLLRGLDNKIDVTLYKSFNGVNEAAIKVEKKIATVPKTGENKGKAVDNKSAVKRQQDEEEGVRVANNNALDVIVADAKTVAYLAYCIEQGYDLDLVKKAFKK